LLHPGGILGGVAFALEGGESFAFFTAESADGFGGAIGIGTVVGDLVLGVAASVAHAVAGRLSVGLKLPAAQLLLAVLSVLGGLLSLPLLLLLTLARLLLPLLLALLLSVLRLTGLLGSSLLLALWLPGLLPWLLTLRLTLLAVLLLGLGEGVLQGGLSGGECGCGGGWGRLALLRILLLAGLWLTGLLLAGIGLRGLALLRRGCLRLARLVLALLGRLSFLWLVRLVRGLLVWRRTVLWRWSGLRALKRLLGLLEGGGGFGTQWCDLVSEVLRLIGGLLVGLRRG
jgi:hypothetical protein